jgi:hypothetical protein
MTSKLVSNGMPLRMSLEFPDSDLVKERKPPSEPWSKLVVRILYIIYSLEVGGFLMLSPWLPFWDNNFLLFRYPILRPIVNSPFLKGAVLGLGIVNLIIGLSEIVNIRKGTGGFFSR